MNSVSLLRHDNYRPDATLDAVRSLLAPLGGMERFVGPGACVVLKPNLVYGRAPDHAVNTHPALVRAIAILAREAGARSIAIGDSPGYGSLKTAADAAGITAVADELGIRLVEFTPVEHSAPGRSFVKLELARELLEADVVINLAKFKTHCQMLMSLAVKNLFGAVPGARKFQWHYRAGRDKAFFARVLNDIALTIRPALSIVDAVLSMDGPGPGSGRPRQTDFLMAGADPWAIDAVAMDILGLERQRLFILADALHNGPHEWQDARTVGERPETLRPSGWDIPEQVTAQMHGQFIERHFPRLAAWIRNRVSPPPFAKKNCIGCAECVRICPAKAMTMERGVPLIDNARCIRCYCCHELCQHDAMDIRWGGLFAKLAGIAER